VKSSAVQGRSNPVIALQIFSQNGCSILEKEKIGGFREARKVSMSKMNRGRVERIRVPNVMTLTALKKT
jgi:hypothetical protein